MVGYPEALTDPSYKSQILTLTFPLVGNYGVPNDFEINPESELSQWFESRKVWASGLVIGELCDQPSHWNLNKSLDQWLREQGVPGIEGIDTRQLTKVIREEGTMLGKIVLEGTNKEDVEFVNPAEHNLVREVSLAAPKTVNPTGSPRYIYVTEIYK